MVNKVLENRKRRRSGKEYTAVAGKRVAAVKSIQRLLASALHENRHRQR